MGRRSKRPEAEVAAERLASDGLAVAPFRPWRSWAITGLLWVLVVCGAVAGALGLARSGGAQAASTTFQPLEGVEASASVLGTAEWSTRAALTAPEATVASLVVDPAERPRNSAPPVEVVAATAIHAKAAGGGYWSVTVAAEVRAVETEQTYRWYLEVGVAETASGPVAVTDPALVPAPRSPAADVEIAGPGPGRPDPSDPVVETVRSFLAALVTGDTTVNRWTAPGVDIWPAAAEGVFTEVDLTGIAVTWAGTDEATARAEITVETADGSGVVFAYTVELVEREGRWEVTDVGGSPPLAAVHDRPGDQAAPVQPLTTAAPAPAPTTPAPSTSTVPAESTRSSTTNPNP